MTESSTLHITSSRDKTDEYAEEFSIDAEIGAFDEGRQDLLQYFSELNILSATKIPLYQLIFPHIIKRARGDLLTLIVLYKKIEIRIKDNEVDRIKCHKIDYKYLCVAADVADQYGISINCETTISKLRIYYSVVTTVIVVIIDQLLLLPFYTNNPNKETIFYSYPGRIQRISMMIQSYSGESITLVPWLNVRYLWNRLYHRNRPETLPINAFVTLTGIKLELIFAIRYIQEIKSGLLVSNIHRHLVDDLNVHMRRSVKYSCLFALERDTRMLLTGRVTDTLHTNISPENVLVHGPSPRERAILKHTVDSATDQYYLPHGIGGIESIPPSRTVTQFVPGEISAQYLQDIYTDETPELVNTGLPHLKDMFQDACSVDESNDELNCVTIATQPYDNSIREKFIEMAIKSASRSQLISSIIIKVHPSESLDFYQNKISQLTNETDVDIKLVDSDLKYYLKRSKIVVTMNSNVGLEAIIYNTPCISLIPHGTLVPPIYAREGPVPHFSTSAEAESFCADLNTSRIERMSQKQTEFVVEKFTLKKDAEKNIIDYIDSSPS